MLRQYPATPPETRIVDIGCALDLLAAAVMQRGEQHVYEPVWIAGPNYLSCLYANRGGPACLVGHALAHATVPVDDLVALRDDSVLDLYREDRLPVTLTLGALVVLHEAQRCQDSGWPWGEVLTHATEVAGRFLDLQPDTVVDRSIQLSDVTELTIAVGAGDLA